MSQNLSPTPNSSVTGKRARSLSLQTRLLVGAILLVLIPALITNVVATYISSQGLREEVFAQLESVVSLKDNQIRTWLATLQTNLNLIFTDQQSTKRASDMIKGEEGNELDRARLKFDLKKYNTISGYFTEIFIMNPQGIVVLSTDDSQEGKIFSSQAFFSEGLKGPYVNPPTYELSLSNYSIVISQPLRATNGQIIGVLAGRVNLSTLAEIMNERAGLGESGETYLVNSNFAVLTNLRFQETVLGETYIHTEGINQAVATQTSGSRSYIDYRGVPVMGVYHWIPELNIAVIAEYDEAEALQPANVVLRVSLFVTLITIFIGSLAAFILTRQISTPIIKLAAAAENIARGDLSREVSVDAGRNDEIGILSRAFNLMTSRLRELIGTLEQRVAERTQALTNVAEISTVAATYNNEQEMLETVVHLTQRRFGLYHAHVFVFDEASNELRIVACGWKEGDEHEGTHGTTTIPLEQEQSLVARAARTKQAVIVNDVRSDAGWLPNPLLPDTASEMAVPLIAGEKVLGVLDVQSDRLNAFTQADADVQSTLANQVASAVQNARSFTEIQHNQALLSDALKAARLGNWEYDFENDLFSFSDEFYAIFRTTAEQVGGYKISSADYARHFVHPDDALLVGTEIQKALDSKDRHFTTNLEHRIIFSNGEVGYIAVSVNVERDENGKIIRWYGANQDITERRRLEEQNRKRAIQAESLDTITQKIQSATKIETALQIAARELGHALGMKPTIVSLDPNALAAKEEKES